MKRFVSVCDQQQLTPPPKLMMGSCTSDEGWQLLIRSLHAIHGVCIT
jgi:hypothetical protein